MYHTKGSSSSVLPQIIRISSGLNPACDRNRNRHIRLSQFLTTLAIMMSLHLTIADGITPPIFSANWSPPSTRHLPSPSVKKHMPPKSRASSPHGTYQARHPPLHRKSPPTMVQDNTLPPSNMYASPSPRNAPPYPHHSSPSPKQNHHVPPPKHKLPPPHITPSPPPVPFPSSPSPPLTAPPFPSPPQPRPPTPSSPAESPTPQTASAGPPPSQTASNGPPPSQTASAGQINTTAAVDYVPEGSLFEILPQKSQVVAVHLVHLPGTDSYFYMERPSGYHPDGSHNIAGSFDLVSRVWTHLDSPDSLFCAGHTLLSNGSVVIVGGHIANAGWPAGIQHIRTYTPGESSLTLMTTMRYPRWYATATLLPDQQVLIMGGTQGVGAGTANNPYYEIWDPQNPDTTVEFPVNPTYLTDVKQNYYPFNYVLPSGDIFNYCSRIGWIMDPMTGTYKVPLPGRPLSAVSPSTVYVTQYPYTGTSVMLPLLPENNYSTVDIMIMGGQNVLANSNLNLTACSESLRISITMPGVKKPSYDLNGGWVQEFMGSPRVMPDSILLPNGVVILMSGTMEGLAGDSVSGGGSKAYYPNFFAEMYDPYAQVGQRWTTLSRSQIPRQYHSTALLTTNGTILVAGCDRCAQVSTNMTYSPAPVKAEYRQEIFYPPFWYDFQNKAVIQGIFPQIVGYGEQFTVKFTGLMTPNVQVTSAVLVAPGSVTHCFNTNQRVIKLEMYLDPYSNIVTLTTPPSPNIAPPQAYMVFLLNGYTYSKAEWITLMLGL